MKTHDTKQTQSNFDDSCGDTMLASLMPPVSCYSSGCPEDNASSTLSASVGDGGVNLREDVELVQRLLNSNGACLSEDGFIGPLTIGAIESFQQETLGWSDGKIDVGQKTWKALSGTLSQAEQTTTTEETTTAETTTTTAEATTTTAENSPNDILSELDTTGAGARTTKQDGSHHNDVGVDASDRMANTDEDRIFQYAELFKEVGQKHGLPPALLAAIASRETRGRNLLFGDHGNGVGLMQVDIRFHEERANRIRGASSEAEQIRIGMEIGAEILGEMLAAVKENHPTWTEAWQLRGAVTGYNSGASNVQTQGGIDGGTTGDDYSADVWQRAKYYAAQPMFGGSLPSETETVNLSEQEEEKQAELEVPETTTPTNGEPDSANFSISEFHSKDGTPVPVNLYPKIQKVMDNLEVLRANLGNSSITINSGYRSPQHNANEGGVPNSRHVQGEAADVKVAGYHPNTVQEKFHELIDEGKIDDGGVGRYNSFTHYDIRGWNARWDKR